MSNVNVMDRLVVGARITDATGILAKHERSATVTEIDGDIFHVLWDDGFDSKDKTARYGWPFWEYVDQYGYTWVFEDEVTD